MPSVDEKRQALKKITNSAVFKKSQRARKLLEYLVTQDVMGNASGIKGLVIAMDVFGKDENFDATSDPLVRVHIGRLRELLATYYENEGQEDALQIIVPVGRYQPEYIVSETTDDPFSKLKNRTNFASLEKELSEGNDKDVRAVSSAEFLGTASRRATPAPFTNFVSRHIKGFWVAMLIVIGLLATILFSLWSPSDRGHQLVEIDGELVRVGPSTTKLLPKLRIFADLNDKVSSGLAHELELGIANFDIVRSVIAAPVSELSDNSKKYDDLDFAMKIEARDTEGVYSLSTFDLKNRELLLSRSINLNEKHDAEIANFLMESAKPEGMIMSHLRSGGFSNELLDCIWKNADYYSNSTAESFSKSINCHKLLVDSGSKVGLSYAEYAGQLADGIGRGYELPVEFESKEAGYNFALKLALKGADLSPYSARVMRDVGFIHSKLGNLAKMNEWLEKAHKSNPLDSSVAASYGFGAVLVGNYDEAARVLDTAAKISVNHPTWWNYYQVLALIMLDDFESANRAATPLRKRTNNKMYLMVRAIIANEIGNEVELKKVFEHLKVLQPEFLASPDAEVNRKIYTEKMKQRLLEKFAKAKASTL